FPFGGRGFEQKAEDLSALDWRRVRNSYARLAFVGQRIQRTHILLAVCVCICGGDGLLTCEKFLEVAARLVQVSCPRREREDAYLALHHARGTISRWSISSRRTRRVSKSVVQNFRRKQSRCGQD